MKLKNYEIENFVKTLKPLKNMILLYGADEGLVYNRSKTIIKAFLGNVYDKNSLRVFDFKDKNSGEIEDFLNVGSLFVEKEVVKIVNPIERNIDWINKKYPENLLVVLCAGELTTKSKIRKRFEEDNNCIAIPCYKTDADQLKKMVIQFANNNSIKFQNDAINYLIENLGDNHQIIVNELNKLLLLKTNNISLGNVKSLISSNGSFLFEDIIFECLAGRKNFFKTSFDYKINDIGDAIILLANTKRYLFLFGNALGEYNKNNITEIVSKHMPKYLFKKKQIFTEIVATKSYEKIAKSIEILSEIEEKMRKNQNLYKAILLRGMLNVAQSMK